MAIIPYVETRVMVDALRAIQLSGNSSIVCVDNGTLQIIRMFLEGYGKRTVNFYISLQQAGYEIPTDAQWDLLQDMIDEFLGVAQMADCSDFVEALQDIALSIQSSSSGSGCCEPGGNGINGASGSQQAPNSFEDDGGGFPEGFTDREEYLDHRCEYIVYRLSLISQDLNQASVVAVVGMTLSSLLVALGVALVTPIPFDELVVMALAIISALGTVGLFASAIEEAQEVVMSDELKCAIFNADTVQQAIDDAIDVVEDLTSGLSSPLQGIVRDILNSFLTTDVLNEMFVNTGQNYPDVVGGCECVSCTNFDFIIVTWGEEVSREVSGSTMTLTLNSAVGDDSPGLPSTDTTARIVVNEPACEGWCFNITASNNPTDAFINGITFCDGTVGSPGAGLAPDPWLIGDCWSHVQITRTANTSPFSWTLTFEICQQP